jgi:hypothetical protein
MTVNKNQKYIYYTKVAWAIYTLITIAIIVILVLFVAGDNEERLFYCLMTAAAAYVFRPSEKSMSKRILKFTGISKVKESE